MHRLIAQIARLLRRKDISDSIVAIDIAEDLALDSSNVNIQINGVREGDLRGLSIIRRELTDLTVLAEAVVVIVELELESSADGGAALSVPESGLGHAT